MYIETSIPRVPGDKAWLSSPVILQMSDTICFSFYYYMYGEDVGTLNVIIRSIDSGSVSSPLWSVFGEKGDFWLKGQIAINVSSDSEVRIFKHCGSSLGGLTIIYNESELVFSKSRWLMRGSRVASTAYRKRWAVELTIQLIENEGQSSCLYSL